MISQARCPGHRERPNPWFGGFDLVFGNGGAGSGWVDQAALVGADESTGDAAFLAVDADRHEVDLLGFPVGAATPGVAA